CDLWNDYIGGLHDCFTILQAVDKRVTGGKGTRIDLSQFECSTAMIGALLISSAGNRTGRLRRGNRSAVCAPQGVYRCAGTDEWCALSVETDEQWKALTKAMEQEDWGSDSRFAAVTNRIRFQDKIARKIDAWTQILPNTEVEFRLKAVGI